MGIIDFFKDIGRRIKGMFLAKNQVEKHMQVKTVISGKSDVVASLTTSISFSKREVTSPECISFWSNI